MQKILGYKFILTLPQRNLSQKTIFGASLHILELASDWRIFTRIIFFSIRSQQTTFSAVKFGVGSIRVELSPSFIIFFFHPSNQENMSISYFKNVNLNINKRICLIHMRIMKKRVSLLMQACKVSQKLIPKNIKLPPNKIWLRTLWGHVIIK